MKTPTITINGEEIKGLESPSYEVKPMEENMENVVTVSVKIKPDDCEHCKKLSEIFSGKLKTKYDYWLYTELFVWLHEGKDYCDKRTDQFKP